jgi:hypothetical protein
LVTHIKTAYLNRSIEPCWFITELAHGREIGLFVDTDDHNRLIGCIDAQEWAREFVKTDHLLHVGQDEGAMLAWFSAAIMSGYDAGQKAERERDFMERLHEVIYQAAGAATSPFMEDHPDYVFPSERVIEGIERVLKEFGIPARVSPDKDRVSSPQGPCSTEESGRELQVRGEGSQ